MSERPTLWRVPKRRFAKVLKGIGVSVATIFFSALIVLLWAFETGKAVEVTKDRLSRELKQSCAVDMELDSLKLSLFPPTVHLDKAAFWSASKEELLSVDEAHVRLAVLPLLYGRIQLDRVSLVRPHASIEIADGQITSLPECLKPVAAPETEPGPPAAPIALGVSDLEVKDARIRFSVGGNIEGDLDGIDVRLKPGGAGTELVLGLKKGSIDAFGHAIPLQSSTLKAEVAGALTRPRVIRVDALELGARRTTLALSGSVDLIGPVFEAKVKLKGPMADAQDFLSATATVTGQLSLDASFSGTLLNPRASGSLIVEGGMIAKKKLADRVEAEFRVNKTELVVSRLEVALADGRVRGSARLDLDDEHLPIKADLVPDHISFAHITDCIDVKSVWVDFKGTGKVTAQGSLRPFKLGGAVDVSLEHFSVFDGGWDRPELKGAEEEHTMLGFPTGSVDATWSADPDGFWIRDAKLRRGTATGTTTARISFEDKNGLYLVADLDAFDFAELGPIGHAHFGGKGRLSATLVGPYWDIRGSGQLDLSGVKVENIPFGNVKSGISWRGTTIALEDVGAILEKSSYAADVTVDFRPSLSVAAVGTVTDGRLEDLLIPFGAQADDWGHPSAKMRGEFDLRGPPTHLTGPITADLTDVVFLDEHAERARVEGHLDQGVLALEAVEAQKHGSTLIGTVRLDPASSEISGHVRTRNLRLAHIDALRGLPDLDGPGEASLDVEGRLGALTGTITLGLDALTARGKDFGGGKLIGHIVGKGIDVKGGMLGGALSVEGKIAVERGLPYSAELKLADTDIPDLVARLSGGNYTWTGGASGHAQMSGRLVEWKDSAGTIFLDHGRFQNGGVVDLELVGAARLGLSRRVLDTKRMALAGPNTKLNLSGQAGADILDLKIQGRTDLAVLSTMFAPIEKSAGTLTVNAVVRRKGGDVDLLGTGHIERGSLEWRNLPSRLSGVDANLTFSQATVLIDRAEGHYAEGNIKASGQVTLDGFKPGVVSLEAEVDQIRPQWSYPKFDLVGTLSGRLMLEGKPDNLLLRGDLVASRSLLRPKLDWRSVVADPSQRIGAGVYDPTKEVLQFDIKMRADADDPVKLKNDTAEADLSGELALTGTNQRIGLLGGLSVGRGRVSFLGREYVVEGGTLEFKERFVFSPYYDLALSARACDARISLNIVGTLDDLSTSYASKPEMEETNIVSCLIRGVRIKDLEQLRGDNRTNMAASFAGEALWRLSGVDREVRKVLPVDQIEVTTEFSKREHVYEPRILVAKEIREGQIRLEYSSSLLKNDDQRAAVRYRITPQLTLQYGWTSSEDMPIGDHGLDLKYRWEW
ncbi:MAG: translocation/assembly module TamB domain-containing protein [Myxococcota bacterium]